MIVLEDRRSLAHDITTAHKAGAGLRPACGIAGMKERPRSDEIFCCNSEVWRNEVAFFSQND